MFDFLRGKKNTITANSGLVGLAIDDNSFTLAHAKINETGKWFLANLKHYEYNKPAEFAKRLKEVVAEQNLTGIDCNWILQAKNFHAYQIPLLDVKPEEMRNAIYWQLKEHIEFPIDEVVFDYTIIKNYSPSRHNDELYIIVSRLSEITNGIEQIKNAGLNIHTVDVSELALRNLICFYSEAKHSNALLRVSPYSHDPFSNYVMLNYENDIQLVRHTDLNIRALIETTDELTRERLREELLLELQRTYDYALSELGIPIPNKLLLGPGFFKEHDIVNLFRAELDSKVFILDINQLIPCYREIDITEQTLGLIAIGGSMRHYAEKVIAEKDKQYAAN